MSYQTEKYWFSLSLSLHKEGYLHISEKAYNEQSYSLFKIHHLSSVILVFLWKQK